MIDRKTIEPLADLLGTLAHPDRLRLLLAIGNGELDVAALAAEVGLSQPRTSQHLALLRAHHVVVARKEGRRSLYAVTQPTLLPWIAQAAGFMEQDAQRTAGLADQLLSFLAD